MGEGALIICGITTDNPCEYRLGTIVFYLILYFDSTMFVKFFYFFKDAFLAIEQIMHPASDVGMTGLSLSFLPNSQMLILACPSNFVDIALFTSSSPVTSQPPSFEHAQILPGHTNWINDLTFTTGKFIDNFVAVPIKYFHKRLLGWSKKFVATFFWSTKWQHWHVKKSKGKESGVGT